jgi:hypothetical protein
MNLHHADRAAEAAMFMENRMRYLQQSAQTRDGYRADIPPRVLAPIFGNTLPSGLSATEYPYPPVAGGLELTTESANDY